MMNDFERQFAKDMADDLQKKQEQKELDDYIKAKKEQQEQEKSRYIDLKGMEERANEKWQREVNEHNAKVRLAEEREQAKEELAIQKLFKGVANKNQEEAEKAKAIAEAEAMKEVDELFDRKGVKSQRTQKLDDGYSSLLKNLTGLND